MWAISTMNKLPASFAISEIRAKINRSGIGGGAGDNQLGVFPQRDLPHCVIIQKAVIVHAVKGQSENTFRTY